MIVIGTKCQLEQTVTEALTAAAAGSGALPVFGTPFMAAMMENAAMTCLQSFLEKEQGSVGTRLDITHDAPTPVGMMARVWAPPPMGPFSSQAATWKSTILPFSDTPVISASAQTFIPTGVGAS